MIILLVLLIGCGVKVLDLLRIVVWSWLLGPCAVAVADGDDAIAPSVASAHCCPRVTAVCSRSPLTMRMVVE